MFKNLSAKYYQENKERPPKKACKRYQNLSKEEKQKLVEHRKKYYKTRKKFLITIIRNYFFKK